MNKLLSYAEASEELAKRGVPTAVGTLQKWKMRRFISVRKIGNRVRIPMSEIDRVLARGEVKALI